MRPKCIVQDICVPLTDRGGNPSDRCNLIPCVTQNRLSASRHFYGAGHLIINDSQPIWIHLSMYHPLIQLSIHPYYIKTTSILQPYCNHTTFILIYYTHTTYILHPYYIHTTTKLLQYYIQTNIWYIHISSILHPYYIHKAFTIHP